MRHARVLVLAALAVPVIAAVAFAQSAVTPIPDPPPVRVAPLEVDLAKTTWGDAKAGQTKAAACAACHGGRCGACCRAKTGPLWTNCVSAISAHAR